MSGWQPISTAPKDGTRILAYGMAYKGLQDGFGWFLRDVDESLKPFTMIIYWTESWCNKEIDNGDGTYRKERTKSYEGWMPEPSAFTPTHWMPLPELPPEQGKERK